jgi:hypothetical protein
MEDDRTTEPAPPPPASEEERAKAEDTSPQDAPADPANDPETEGDNDAETETDGTATAAPVSERSVTDQLPRTTTTGDDEQDLRSAGDGAVSGPPGDDLDDSTQAHD